MIKRSGCKMRRPDAGCEVNPMYGSVSREGGGNGEVLAWNSWVEQEGTLTNEPITLITSPAIHLELQYGTAEKRMKTLTTAYAHVKPIVL